MAEEVSTTFKGANCEICGLMTEFRRVGGVIMCLACKRFYLRNRNKAKSLVCLSAKRSGNSSDNCCVVMVDEQQSTSNNTNSSSIRRKICPACRLQRCISLRTSRNKKQQQTEDDEDASNKVKNNDKKLPATTMVITEINNGDLQTVDETLRNLVEGAKQFLDQQNTLELRNHDCYFADYFQLFQSVVPHVSKGAVNVKNFINCLPGYKDIALQDRCHLFPNCVSITFAESTYHNPEPLDLGMNKVNFTGVVNFFPELGYFSLESRFMKGVLDEWQPTEVEFAFLLALLFTNYGINDTPLTATSSQVLDNMRKQLESVYTAYGMRQFGVVYYSKRRDYQSRAIALFSSATSRRFQTFSGLIDRYPLLHSLCPLFTEIISQKTQNVDNNN